MSVGPKQAGSGGGGRLPDAFERVIRGRSTLIVRREYREQLVAWGVFELDQRSEAHESGDAAEAGASVGRAQHRVLIGPTDGGSGRSALDRLFVREYRHGGVLGGVFGGAFLGDARPCTEIVVSDHARDGGVHTPEIIACLGRRGWIFHRWRLVQRALEDCEDLVAVFRSMGRCPDRNQWRRARSILEAVAKQVRLMHDVGVYHADLHVKNIMVPRGGDTQAILVDLDKSVDHGEALPWDRRFANLIRLDRSVEKLNRAGAGVSRADRLRFLRAYLKGKDELTRDQMDRFLVERRRAIRRHRAGWRFGGWLRQLGGRS